ncbi:hypothetical protein OAL74_03895 [Candidatus Pelagibacter sp.]|nr:hypothetical protein [Candidatus Pelagibacter sp.]
MLTLNNKNKVIFISLAVLIFAIHQIMFLSYLNIGSVHFDYQSALSRLIFGKIWFLKNGLTVPWFGPHICCGLPFFSDPESEFYSPIQFLFLFLSPMATFKIVFFGYSLLGFLGFFLVSKNIFKLTNNASLIGATIFLFNHCFAFHYLSGHIAWGLYYLVPFFFYISALSVNRLDKLSSIFLIICSGLIFAIIMHSGGTRILIEILFIIFFLTLLHLINYKNFKIILYVSISVLIGLLISSSKIYAAWSFIEGIPRDVPTAYFTSLRHFILVFFDFFFFSPREFIEDDVVKMDYQMTIEELSFNLSILPLIILIIYLRNFPKITNDNFKLLFSFILLICAFLLILVNFSNTFIGSVVNQIPFINTDWLSFRKLTPFIVLFSILSAMMFDKISFKNTNLITILFVSIVIIQNFSFDRNKLYNIFKYTDLDPLINNNISKDNIDNYKIEEVITLLDENSNYMGPNTHESFLRNQSSQFCYFPILGYDLEKLKPIVQKIKFDLKQSRKLDANDNRPKMLYSDRSINIYKGDPLIEINGELNFINPSCYLNPKENDCDDNFLFKIDKKEELKKFLNYKPFDFKHLKLQIFFNFLSVIVLFLTLTYFFYYLIFKIKKNPSKKN